MRIVPVRPSASRFLAHVMTPGVAPQEEEGGASATDIIAAGATLAALTPRLGVPAPDDSALGEAGSRGPERQRRGRRLPLHGRSLH